MELRNELQKITGQGETFQFTEYFTLSPFAHSDLDSWQEAQVFCPFIRRVADENQFLWLVDTKGKFKLQPRSAELLKIFDDPRRFLIPTKLTFAGASLYSEWRNKGLSATFPSVAVIDPDSWEGTLRTALRVPDNDVRDALLLEYGLLGVPWHVSSQSCVMYCYPIASDAMFYGYFILIIPDDAKGCADLLAPLCGTMREIVNDIYLPVLAFLHETLFEQELLGEIERHLIELKKHDKDGAGTSAMTLLRHAAGAITRQKIPFLWLGEPQSRTALPLERELCALWQRRSRYVTSHANPSADPDALVHASRHFAESLVFAKYHVASPGIVKQVVNVVTRAKDLRPPTLPGGALPSALVFGTPGSGKDTLARMIPVFTPEYFDEPVYTINMSALRPDFLTGPLLQGLTVLDSQIEGEPKRQGFLLEGLFVAAARPAGASSRFSAATPARKVTFILDELNSLDVDLQGILLRILEQGEVTPLLGLHAGAIEHLVIGIVNENPAEISRQAEIASILYDKGTFGSLLGGLLYEAMRRSRRLRDDLFHRLSRKLYVEIPDINDRREDIPILFYDTVTRLNPEARVDLPAYRLLISAGLQWPGNVRDIQRVAGEAVSRMRGNRLTRADLTAALKNVPHVMKGAVDAV